MKKITKKILAMSTALVLCTAFFSACSGKTAESKSDSTSKSESTTESKVELKSLTLSHQPYGHGLPSYIALEEGLFEKAGLDAKILMFTSGPAQNEALGANEWDAGAMGTPPSITGGIAYNSKIIGISVDDTVSVDYWVRPDSDIAKIKGKVPGCPDIYGNADTWRGKTILCPTATSAHFMLIATLEKMGLTQEDVNIIHMDVAQGYTAFKAGQGDILASWDPQSYSAEKEGWVRVSSGEATGEVMPTVLVASEKAIKEKPEEIKLWLKTYFEVCDKYKDDIDKQSEYLLKMQLDNGINTTEELAKRFCEDRPMPSLDYNKEVFAGKYGEREVDEIVEKIIDFFVGQGSIKESDKQKLIDNGFIDSEFIDALTADK